MVRAQRGLTWRLAASSAEKALRSPWGRCHQQRWIGAAGHRRWARTVMAASPSTTTRAGAATSCSWAPTIDQSSPTVRPSRWVWARRRGLVDDGRPAAGGGRARPGRCLLYTSDAADEEDSVD